ncbi:UPF0548 protein At2g17695-like isoform X3 [Arachis ipaensis]|uniref:UPF0548 protein At2g17695-like isoform X3 n=1 Tax=Arachis ipaensis TaxID=130454 RepID=UPI000A2B5428|nr:UPF0548 protein At2g17695-like isoform X3 [Arachis ipaensis]XP_020973308.1 UPF0548 protein At2g17695-like isoform X3 [Arachis ipaensis]XP_020973309.1 UPF0548 protein At2g17695-like isoform X3 [Arachis ipaensis]
MVFLSWGRPSPQDQKACIKKSGTFNYDVKYKGATGKSLSSLEQDEGLSKDGFLLNNKRVLLGSGVETFEKSKAALKSWSHLGLDWAFVDPKTAIKEGEKFCVCVKELLPWLMMPLQVVYVNESRKRKGVASFGFGSGTLHGHLLKMVFLSWGRPSPKDQKACINKSGTFNYDGKYKGFTAKSISSLEQDEGLSKDGFSLNNKRVLLGSGAEVFENAKIALKSWRHFGLDWTFVDPKTQIKQGEKFCVCVKEFLPWVMMPLQVVYVNESSAAKRKRVASFGFGSGTLHGHLLAAEERFSVEIDENNQVWYEVLSFSKPAHILSFVAAPYVKLRQKYFADESAKVMLKHISSSK